jgi:hypothetical protein
VSNFELTSLVMNDLNPKKIITSAKSDLNFINFLKKKCKIFNETIDLNNDNDNDASELEEENQQNDSNSEVEEDFQENSNQSGTQFFLSTSNDYMYETSKEIINEINTLENMPQFINVADFF